MDGNNVISGRLKALYQPKYLLVIPLVLFFVFGLYNIGNYITADEHFWLFNVDDDRVNQYWKSMLSGDWEDTRINDKPGITLAYTSGIALLFQKSIENQVVFNDDIVKVYDPAVTKRINFLFRLPILIISGLSSLMFFWLIKKITENDWIALFASTLILLSPVLLGMSQIANPDSMFWIFSSLSILTFFLFLKNRERKLGILTGVLFGLAMASKYVALILVPFFFFMILAYYFFNWEKLKAQENSGKSLSRIIGYYWGVIVGGVVLFSLMMPAVFVKPEYLYSGTIGFSGMKSVLLILIPLNLLFLIDNLFIGSKITRAVFGFVSKFKIYFLSAISMILLATTLFIAVNWMLRHALMDLSNIPYYLKTKDSFSELPFLHRFIVQFVPLVFGLTPVALLSLMYLWLKSIANRSRFDDLIFILSVFYLIFIVVVIEQGLLLTVRYSIILFPLSAILAAIAFYDFFSDRKIFEKQHSAYLIIYSLILTSVIACFIASLKIQPLMHFSTLHHRPAIAISIWSAAGLAVILFFILKAINKKLSRPIWAFAIILVSSIASLWMIKPHFFIYTSNLLPKKYTITGTWSYGGYEAAQYLNSQPNAENLTIWTDAWGICEFFVGRCIHRTRLDTQKYQLDYMVRTYRGQLSPKFSYSLEKPSVWKITLDGRAKNYLRIYKIDKTNQSDMSEEGSDPVP